MPSPNTCLSRLPAELQLQITLHLISHPTPNTLISFLGASPVAASLFRRYGVPYLHKRLHSLLLHISCLSAPMGRLSDRPARGVTFQRRRKAITQLEQWVEFALRVHWANGKTSNGLERVLKGTGPIFRRYGSVGSLLRRVKTRRRMLAGIEVTEKWGVDRDRDWTRRLLGLRTLRSGKVRR